MATKNYTINFVDPTKSTLNILPNTQAGPRGGNRQTDIDLIGMGNSLWGEAILENFIHMLENFSCTEDIHAIATVPSTSTFTVLGDVEKAFLSGSTFDIFGSDNNDGNYTVNSAIYNGTTATTITISAPSLNTTPGNFGSAGEQGVPNKALDFSPTTPVQGQLWYNQTSGEVNVYDIVGSPAVGTWKSVGGAGTTIVTISATPPSSPVAGDLWWEPTGQELSIYNGGWVSITGSYVLLDGTAAMTGALNMGTNKIEAVADPDSADDAVNLGYADARYVNITGDTMSGILNMGSNKIEAVANPDSADDAVNLGYADARYVEIAGDTMTGILNMGTNKIEGVADPDSNDDAVNLGFADTRYVNVTGDTMTGFLTLNADPTNALHAATMQYVDNLVGTSGAKTVTYVSKSGYNSIYFLINGKMYSASGYGGYSPATTGRGPININGTAGLDQMREVRPTLISQSQSPIKQIGGGFYTFGYILLENGYLWTWGRNQNGQCGLGHTSAVAVPTLAETNVEEVYDHPSNGNTEVISNRLFIKKADGYIYGCGENNNGALGLGDTVDRNVFTQISSLGTTVTSFWNMGATWGCFVAQKADGTIWVAGSNDFGQFGNGTTASVVSTPVDVTSNWTGAGSPIDWTITSVHGGFGYYAGGFNSSTWLAMLLDNGVDTKFSISGVGTYGTLGNGGVANISTPFTPSVGTGRIDKVAGFGGGPGTINLLKEDGNLYTWGYNVFGQCGNGTTSAALSPTNVTSSVTDLFSDGMTGAANGHLSQSFIKKSDGHVYASGYNVHGELGVGYRIPSSVSTFTPVLLPYDADTKLVGHYTSTGSAGIIVAVTADNRIYGWGYGGQRAVINSISPQDVLVPILFDVEGLD